MKASTGLRNKALDTGSVKATMDGGLIKIYSGTVPASADDAISGPVLLCTISSDGAGAAINFDSAASGGILAKAPGETWHGTNVAGGTASFYRHVASGDTAGASATEARIQGTIAVAGADLNLSSVALSNGAPQTVDFYSVAFPTL